MDVIYTTHTLARTQTHTLTHTHTSYKWTQTLKEGGKGPLAARPSTPHSTRAPSRLFFKSKTTTTISTLIDPVVFVGMHLKNRLAHGNESIVYALLLS